MRVEEDCSFLNGIFSLLLVPNGVGVGLEVDGAACLLPAFQNRHNGTAAVHPDAGRICNTASEAASAAILYRNTDRADGFACHPHRRDAFRLRRNTGHRLKAPQEQLSVASVLGVRCCVLCPAGGIGLRRSYYSTKPVPVKLIRALLCSAFIRPLTLITQHLQGAEKHLAASLLPHFLAYFRGFSSSSSRSVIFRRLMPRVDPLCSSAEVAGGSTPATPSAISVRLKPTMKR